MSTIRTIRSFDEIIDFIISIPSLEHILAFQPSPAACHRLAELLYKKQNDNLSIVEKQELEQFILVKNLMRLAKARAKQRLAAGRIAS